jgi:hypothetical protein
MRVREQHGARPFVSAWLESSVLKRERKIYFLVRFSSNEKMNNPTTKEQLNQL